MTPTASTARWRPRVRNRWVALACKALLLLVGVVLAAQYLAGFLFLQWVHSDPKTATPLTVARYGYYFSERKDIRRKLWVSSGAGLALVMLPVILALRPRARPLHGSARFSTRGEARHAGLFSPVGIILARLGRRRTGHHRRRPAGLCQPG